MAVNPFRAKPQGRQKACRIWSLSVLSHIFSRVKGEYYLHPSFVPAKDSHAHRHRTRHRAARRTRVGKTSAGLAGSKSQGRRSRRQDHLGRQGRRLPDLPRPGSRGPELPQECHAGEHRHPGAVRPPRPCASIPAPTSPPSRRRRTSRWKPRARIRPPASPCRRRAAVPPPPKSPAGPRKSNTRAKEATMTTTEKHSRQGKKQRLPCPPRAARSNRPRNWRRSSTRASKTAWRPATHPPRRSPKCTPSPIATARASSPIRKATKARSSAPPRACSSAARPGRCPGPAGGVFPAGESNLSRYASRLGATEINSSFYRPHLASTYERWAASVPVGFCFSVKMPQEISHHLRLVRTGPVLDTFLEGVKGLGGKLGCLLLQLPPEPRVRPPGRAAVFRDAAQAARGCGGRGTTAPELVHTGGRACPGRGANRARGRRSCALGGGQRAGRLARHGVFQAATARR